MNTHIRFTVRLADHETANPAWRLQHAAETFTIAGAYFERGPDSRPVPGDDGTFRVHAISRGTVDIVTGMFGHEGMTVVSWEEIPGDGFEYITALSRERLVVLRAARDGLLTYTPSARVWCLDGRMVAHSTINVDPKEPDECLRADLMKTFRDGFDHERAALTLTGYAVMVAAEREGFE